MIEKKLDSDKYKYNTSCFIGFDDFVEEAMKHYTYVFDIERQYVLYCNEIINIWIRYK